MRNIAKRSTRMSDFNPNYNPKKEKLNRVGNRDELRKLPPRDGRGKTNAERKIVHKANFGNTKMPAKPMRRGMKAGVKAARVLSGFRAERAARAGMKAGKRMGQAIMGKKKKGTNKRESMMSFIKNLPKQ